MEEGSQHSLSFQGWLKQSPRSQYLSYPSRKMRGFTCRTRPERGSITRSFLSLHVVVSRLPSVLKDMQRITSEWQSIIFTGSPTSRFQMRTWEGRDAGGRLSPAGRDALCRVACAGMGDHVGGFYIKGGCVPVTQIHQCPWAGPSPGQGSVPTSSKKDECSWLGPSGWHIYFEGIPGVGVHSPHQQLWVLLFPY